MSYYKPDNGKNAAILTIELPGTKTFKINMRKELAINKNRLDDELADHPGKYAHFASILVRTKRAKREYEAKIMPEIMEDIENREYKVSKHLIESYLEADDEWQDWHQQEEMLEWMMTAMDQRGKILHNQSSVMKRDHFQERA